MKNCLPQLRAQRGWTQSDLAERLKVPRRIAPPGHRRSTVSSLNYHFTGDVGPYTVVVEVFTRLVECV